MVDGVLLEDLVPGAVLVDGGSHIHPGYVFFKNYFGKFHNIQPKLLVPYFFTFVTLGSPTN